MFDVKHEYIPKDHPYYNETFNITLRTIQKSGVPDEQVSLNAG